MKKLLLIFVIVPFFCFSQQNAAKILGVYWTPKKDGKIEIYSRNNLYFGKVLEGKKPRKDTLNPVISLRSRQVIGMEFMLHFKFENNVYVDGEIYDPESGKTYSCKMWLENDNLKVRGYIGFSLLGRTELFERFK